LVAATPRYVGRYQTYVDYVPTNWEKDHLILGQVDEAFHLPENPFWRRDFPFRVEQQANEFNC